MLGRCLNSIACVPRLRLSVMQFDVSVLSRSAFVGSQIDGSMLIDFSTIMRSLFKRSFLRTLYMICKRLIGR
jgi:hypothetical protein